MASIFHFMSLLETKLNNVSKEILFLQKFGVLQQNL